MTVTLQLVVPSFIDDPARPSGGNVYDRELANALSSWGVEVRVHPVGPDLQAMLSALPDGATVLVDGLVGLGAGRDLALEARRLRLWLLVHLPLALADPDLAAQELAALSAAEGVLTTSRWTRSWLLDRYPLNAARVHVAPPGVAAAPLNKPSGRGARLACVGALTAAKGQDVLVSALSNLTDLDWSCALVGSVERDPAFVADLRSRISAAGLAGRVVLSGPIPPTRMGAVYQDTDLVVVPTLLETYGMVVTEAMARGIPVLASEVGGVPEAMGSAAEGSLISPGDVAALSSALRRWLEDPLWREERRVAALARRSSLAGWSSTARMVLEALRGGPSATSSTREAVLLR